jgi:Recombination endonuclease VII
MCAVCGLAPIVTKQLPGHRPYWACEWKLRQHTLSRVGATLSDYYAMFLLQEGRCRICGHSPEGDESPLSVDHVHEHGGLRGLLCGRCNCGIGYFRDDPDLLRSAASYLESRAVGELLTPGN